MAKRTNRRRLWLYIVLGIVALLVMSGPVGSWLEYRRLGHVPGEVVVYIGIYQGIPAGQRASLLCLSQEIARYPKATMFGIRRADSPFAWDDIDWNETEYYRQSGTIYDGNFWAGGTEAWDKVSDQTIKKVVATSGKFQGFSGMGWNNIEP